MIRKSVAFLAVLGLCACGPELEPTEGEQVQATHQDGLLADDARSAATLNVEPQGVQSGEDRVPVLPPPPMLPLDPIPLSVVRPVAPPVQLVAPAVVTPTVR